MRQNAPFPGDRVFQPSRRHVLQWLGMAALSIAAGCAGSHEPAFTIAMTDREQFSPVTLEIAPGTRVAWKNSDTDVHTATFDPAALQALTAIAFPVGEPVWDSGNLYSGQVWSYQFDTPGEYVYFCRYHGERGMLGTIRVIEREAG